MGNLVIDVWDCRIRSLAFWDRVSPNPEYLPDELLEDDAIYESAVADVNAQGGAINMSAWYEASADTLALVRAAMELRSLRSAGGDYAGWQAGAYRAYIPGIDDYSEEADVADDPDETTE